MERMNTTCQMDVGGVHGDPGGGRCDAVMNVIVPDPGAVIAAVGATQLPCGIVPEQVSVTGPVKLPSAPIVTVMLLAVPGVAEAVEGALTVKSQPVPLKATVCGLPVALSAIVTVPVRGSLVVELGAKVTLIVQVEPTATVAPLQVFVWVKSLETLMAEAPNIREAVPVFITVTV